MRPSSKRTLLRSHRIVVAAHGHQAGLAAVARKARSIAAVVALEVRVAVEHEERIAQRRERAADRPAVPSWRGPSKT
jgi:hypothetical protein